ncbi:hypothetical protein SARC_07564 [Sphaeroforma arctica JP610]|uniref:F-box domain-containing protein n=1 Tax=Sphaeroforma arctica JP610 TaxID=667725 RepID=A0A0L0FTC1_9EUKA|nr:hypothetical protein SARC_07564 [Sphaeroforma arctica JP610]KNC80055.1 hypothetical protein SARC_07564 [Sphaeroforma arctica JP610]|eukprot:XP_014153957.1 hypothetical protein SARC_07564 [Sphaeroforma arctica JP610]
MFDILSLPQDLQERVVQTLCVDDHQQLALSCKTLKAISDSVLVESAVIFNTILRLPVEQRFDAISVDDYLEMITKVKLHRQHPLVSYVERLNSRRGVGGVWIFLTKFNSREVRIQFMQIICALGYKDILKRMIRTNYLPSTSSFDVALLLACRYGHISVVQTLLNECEVDPAMQCNLPIRYASLKGSLDVVAVLLADKRVNPADDNNNAIRWSCEKGHTNVVKMLLEDQRVDPAAADDDAVRMSAEHGRSDIVEILSKDSRVKPASLQNYAIRMACANGHVNVVEFLLRLSKEPIEGRALAIALKEGETELVELLLAHADIDPSDRNNSALRLAAKSGHHDVVHLLLTDRRVRAIAGGEL